LLALATKTPDITLQELAEHLRKAHGLRVVESTVWRFLDRHGMTFKKTAHVSEQQRPDVLDRRRAWFAVQPDLDPERLASSTRPAPPRRWHGFVGGRCAASVPARPFRTVTGKRRPLSVGSACRA
jgi:hypothetical protein